MKNRVLLTGCTGELGSLLTQKLINLGFEVFGIRGRRECKITDPLHNCQKVDLLDPTSDLRLRLLGADFLVHTAWVTEPRRFWQAKENTEWVNASKRLISEFLNSGGKYIAVTGSCAEYSWEIATSLSESSLTQPATLYGSSKLELLSWLGQVGVPYLWTRTFFQFGLNEPNGRLIPSAIDSLLQGGKFEVQNSFDIRDFVYIKDVAEILSQLIAVKKIGIVNIGNGLEVQVGDLVQTIFSMVGRGALILNQNTQAKKSYVVSNPKKLETLLPSFSWTPLNTALTETIKSRLISLG